MLHSVIGSVCKEFVQQLSISATHERAMSVFKFASAADRHDMMVLEDKKLYHV